jgi:hypothetical protein
MILMSVNFGSKPKMSCSTVIESMMIIGFLYFKMNCFIALTAATTRCAARRLSIDFG